MLFYKRAQSPPPEAFTLAEVLITLGIIGVVAAITIPTLISNHKKSVVENQLKTAYSLIAQTVTASEAMNENYKNWDYSANADLNKYVLSHFKIAKNCGQRGTGCFKTIPSKNNIDGWYNLNGKFTFAGGYAPTYYYKVILSNGMSLAVRTMDNHFYKFVIDINGPKKGKSILGEDVFVFTLSDGTRSTEMSLWAYESGLRPGSECADGVSHKQASMEKLLNDPSCRGGCNPNASDANGRVVGEACSAVIMKNNWKIPDNYPIKF